MTNKNLLEKLQGFQSSKGPVGIAARGKNVYRGTSHAAHKGGGPQYGRPRKRNTLMRTYPQKAFGKPKGWHKPKSKQIAKGISKAAIERRLRG